MKGTIKRLIADKGFGFIEGQNGVQIFFHFSGVKGKTEAFNQMEEGMEVSYDESTSERTGKPQAINVEII